MDAVQIWQIFGATILEEDPLLGNCKSSLYVDQADRFAL
ncbi:hypothetical protein T4E_11580 [Trichinella pseudospiralis]|uniref:Uncharacterized protein n=1 Tax=Trichinella pseudospiralis TaxID=6337 RepID=A0A0V0XVA1_TRIPS|nr:hypothetical protein T4E_11580 [Trichinella pseudospiralis]